MTTDQTYYDIYLYWMHNPDYLYKIGHVDHDQARKLCQKWFEMGEDRDYMLVTEDSKPYFEDTKVSVVDSEWIDQQQ